ncbi:LOW QUALITY PROTEIN: putative neural-cadherin 2 [Macrobrachium nipponense]|uniref:LOW QUALITY PROTEIN: putative neural-cadherin 2 n=1 Tax=Macrobrachium nipponense TaxID=159736 RepID=UPI0030C7D7C6
MAINVVLPILIPLEENLHNATRLLSGSGRSLLEFTQHRYCALLREDAPTSSDVITVVAHHEEGASIRYSITGGNRDGLFTIDQKTGLITLAASLDYELYDKHELVVSGEGGGQVVHTIVQVAVADVNDNPPVFADPDPYVTIIEEDDRHLPTTLIKVEASDPDLSDESGLLYTLRGDGVDGYSPEDAFFKINPRTGDLMQLRALDRDPPNGKRIWKLRVKVQDGQEPWKAGNRIKGTKNTSVNKSDRLPSWDYENGFQNDQPIENTLGRGDEVTKHNRNSGFKLESSKVREDEVRNRLWEAKGNGYDRLVSSARKHAWARERNRKYKARPFFWTQSNDRQNLYTQHSWKLKDISYKETKQLSWNDQARFGIPKSVYNYKNEEHSHKKSGELSKRIKNEKNIDNWVSRSEPKVKESEELDKVTESTFSSRRSNADDHTWHVNRLRESLSESTNRRTQDGHRAVVENTKRGRGLEKEQRMKDRISLRKSRSGEFLVLYPDTSSVKGHILEQNSESSNSRLITFAAVKNQNTETNIKGNVKKFRVSDSIGQHPNFKSDKVFQKGDSICKSQISTCGLIPEANGVKQIRKNSQSSWRNSLKARIKFRNEAKLHKIESNTDDPPGYLISLDKFKNPHTSTSDWEDIEGSAEGQLRQEPHFVKKAKRSPDGVLETKRKGSNILYESPSVIQESIETKSTVHNLESIQESEDQFRSDNLNDIKEKKTESLPGYSGKSIEASSSMLVSLSNVTKKPSASLFLQSKIESARKGVIANNSLDSAYVSANSSKLDKFSHNLKSNFSKTTASLKLLEPQMDGFTLRDSSDVLSKKTSKYPNNEYSSSIGQTPNTNHLLTSSEVRNVSLSMTKSRLPAFVARNRQIRSSTQSYVRCQKAKEQLGFEETKRQRLALERSQRHLNGVFFQYVDLDEEECYQASQVSGRVTDEAGNQKDNPVHEVEILVTIVVKDINDNAPIFPNVTMFGEVRENGPVALSVAEVSAWDADDATEGTNARITYAIEKNVIHDKTGEAIFSVDPSTPIRAWLTTALCCLDRENDQRAPSNHIQVVAADGGGLKGTGTVVVRLTDENDNSPRLARQYWELEVDETWGAGPPNNMTLLEMTAADPDTKNHFSYKIVEESGWGWDHFGIRSTGASGQLYALRTLDYEDDTHRQGFKFMVQVTDRGEGGWVDPRHQDTAWVGVKLRDLNDNPPQFVRPHAHVTISEDAPLGTLLTTVSAHDPDVGVAGQVDYSVVGGWNSLKVDKSGGVRLFRRLDREAEGGALGVAKILGTDRGEPPLTATATLTMTVTDVNDCPPRLLPPDVLHVTEGAPPVLLGVLTATDDDIWALGHGPPFSMSLSPSNPPYVTDLVSLKFYQHFDSGRGGAELWTRGSLDRETHRTIPVEVVIGDAGGLNRTNTVTVVVKDLNDNPMKPAAKMVYLWKTQGSGSEAPLGRVYVDDPDDWDIADKTFRWAGKPHPLFTLNADDGSIIASSLVREGRYLLHFAVSDRVWSQVGVAANVTVVVRTLTHDALTHAAPVLLTPVTPADLTRGWTPTTGGGGLGKLLEAVHDIISEGPSPHKVEVVSVYGNTALPGITSTVAVTSPKIESSSSHPQEGEQPVGANSSSEHPAPTTCVWVSVKDDKDAFVDPVRLQGLLSLRKDKLEKATGLSVSLKDPPPVFDKKGSSIRQVPKKDTVSIGHPSHFEGPEDSALSTLKLSYEDGASVTSLASTALPLQVVDTNMTSLVTPLLIRRHECVSQERPRGHGHASYDSDTCAPSSCLNGGRCVRFPSGSRCVCPGGSWGPQCKILSRTFRGSGWVWLRPLSPCLPTTLSLRVLTRRPHGLLLYSGPLAPHSEPFGSSYWSLPSPMLALQVVESKPQLIVEGIGSSFVLTVNASVTDGEWHTVHLHLHQQGVALMVDFCGLGWDEKTNDDSHCVARKAWGLPEGLRAWEVLGPLQIGGLAQGPQRSRDYGWSQAPTPHSLDGCLSNLEINDQLMDLGETPCSKDSTTGCQPQETACLGGPGTCGIRGACSCGLNHPECHCDPGWTGVRCDTPTAPATLGPKSYMKLALSFTPSSRVVSVQLRVRTLGESTGMLVRLAAQHTQHSFTVHLRTGVACASVSGAGWAARVVCVEGRPVGDGQWHTVRAERHGHSLVISVDGADEGRVNRSIPSLVAPGRLSNLQEEVKGPPMPLEIDKHDGVTVGGLPEFLGVRLVTVAEDLQGTCIDDLRVSDRQLPLPPAVNGSTWGQVTTLDGFMKGCNPPTSCVNATCDPPLSCHASWTQPSCSCGSGRHLAGSTCEDVNECLFEPCLHGGNCYDLKSGYLCLCGPNHIGDNCEWAKVSSAGHPLTAPAVIAAVTLSLLFLVLIGVFISLRHHRLRTAKTLGHQETEQSVDKDSTIIAVRIGCKGSVMTLDAEKRETFLGLRSRWKETARNKATTTKRKGPGDESHTTFLELLKLNRAKPAKESKKGGNAVISSGVSTAVITSAGVSGSQDIALVGTIDHQHHHLAGEDLRNYAYEGDGSSSGSLTSTISGLRAELEREEPDTIVAADFVEVMDLLKNLPEAPKTSILLARLKEKRTSVKEARDAEVISTVSLGSLRRGEPSCTEYCKHSSKLSPPTVSSGSFPRPLETRNVEMISPSTGAQLACMQDELTTTC